MVYSEVQPDAAVAELHRTEWAKLLSTLIRQLGDFELAEDALQEAFAAAVSQWRLGGLPASPRAWVLVTARNKGIDAIRRREKLRQLLDTENPNPADEDVSDIPDDRLQLLCTCCHPALSVEAQVALTLRSMGGLSTPQIARAFLVPETTMAQRLVRAKSKIRDAGIPYKVPDQADMPDRLDAILATLYLVFNQGYSDTSDADLSAEAIRLVRQLIPLLEPESTPEPIALLALMLLQNSRRPARTDSVGDLIVLKDQKRSLWNLAEIEEVLPLVESSLSRQVGPFAVQAAIAALHCRAASFEETDWEQIVTLYEVLEQVQPTPIVTLNRAAAMSMVHGPEPALKLLDGLELDEYPLYHSARGELLAQTGEPEAARAAYQRALDLTVNLAERRFILTKLKDL